MNYNEYVKVSENTEKKFDEGLKADTGVFNGTLAMMEMVMYVGFLVDSLKKHVIYDKPLGDLEKQIETNVNGLIESQSSLESFGPTTVYKPVEQDKAEVFHAMLGLVSEMAEVIELLTPYVKGKELDPVKLGEELADMQFYNAILYRKFNIDAEDSLAKNVAKLKVRYPDKFSNERALNRDLDAEKKVLE